MQRIASLFLRKLRAVRAIQTLALLACLFLTVGCTARGGSTGLSGGLWLESGSLALSRPIPRDFSRDRARLGYLPPPEVASTDAVQIVISRDARTITAVRPGASPVTIKTQGAELLPTGSFSVTLKEERPLWYAPNEYFTKRSLKIPEQGCRTRFMRAALGHRVIYLNDQTPIHSGPVWLKEIGGMRLNKHEIDQLYSMVSVGTRVEVR
jgi:hypothetical protein